MTQRSVIVGDGAMGMLCALLLHHNGHRVAWWGHEPDYMEEIARTRENPRYMPGVRVPVEIEVTGDDKCVRDAALLVSAVPCQYVREVWLRLASYVAGGVPICSITKGIENESLLRPSQTLREAVKTAGPVAVLSGPCIAIEVAQRLPAAVVVASADPGVAEAVQRAFSTPWFRVYTNPDPVGVELAGATKNVIALAAGMIDGLSAGSNCKAALLTRGIVEITRLGVAMGAEKDTFAGLAGLGDLVTTCICPTGRNRTAGELIGRGKTAQQVQAATPSVIEGIATTRSVVALAGRQGVEMPITQSVHRVLFEQQDPLDALVELMSRQPKPEAVM